jgi:short subunit dehydrogenase-like uncharacterized protein
MLYVASCYYLILSAFGLQLPTIAFQNTISAHRLSFSALISSASYKQHPPSVSFRKVLRSFHITNMSSENTDDPLPCPISSHGKTVPQVSTTEFLATAACIPVWAVTVLPLSLAYQLGKMALQPLLPTPQSRNHLLDSGYVVDPSLLIPRAERKYDIVVLGVTGFTGYLAARHLLTQYGVSNSSNSAPVKWAIAGRSREKLERVKQRLQEEYHVDTSGLEIIVVDTSLPSTLPQLVQNTRVVATTAGPYTLYGNGVVEFCAKFGTHYVDITGEVDWVKAMICQWQSTAQQTGAKLIPFCGHGAFLSICLTYFLHFHANIPLTCGIPLFCLIATDSIPWDLSAMELQSKLLQEQSETAQSLSFWDEVKSGAPGGTFATVIANVEGKAIQAPRVDFDPFLRLPDGSKSSNVCKAKLSWLPSRFRSTKKWTSPFVMAMVNSQVVRWSYALRSESSTQSSTMTYSESQLHPTFATAVVNYAGLGMFGSLLFNPLTLYLTKAYLIPKPGEGPTMVAMETKRTRTFIFAYRLLNI